MELVVSADEAARHGLAEHGDPATADLAVVLGGDGTMLRALRTFLGTGIPVLGVNFGRVGFLSAVQQDGLEAGIAPAFAGEIDVVELPTLEVVDGGTPHVAVNDVVVASAELGRMVELEWAVGGEDLGARPLRRHHLLDALRLHGLQPLERRPGADVGAGGDGHDVRRAALAPCAPARGAARARRSSSSTGLPTSPVVVLVDGHRVGQAGTGGRVTVGLGEARTLLATLPEATFVSRYRKSFSA